MIKIIKQLKYSINDIFSNIFTYAILFLQMVVILLLIAFTISQLLTYKEYTNKLELLSESKAFISMDHTSLEKINYLMNEDEDAINRMRKLYQNILTSKDIKQSTLFSYNMTDTFEGRPILQYFANEGFFDVFNQEVISGRSFTSTDFKNTSEIIPILVGYNLKDKYKLNEIYRIENPVNGETERYKVVGILEYNSNYVNLDNLQTDFTDFNNSYIRPLSEESTFVYHDFSFFDLAINSTVIITENEKKVEEIVNKSNELGLFSLDFVTLEKNLSIINDRTKQLVYYEGTILVLLLIFSLIGFISALIGIISKKMLEYSIHFMCGATTFLISFRIIIQVSIVIVISFIPVLVIFKLSYSTLYTLIFTILLILIILIYPINKLRNQAVITNIRRNK